MSKHYFSIKIEEEITKAIHQFGTYSFDDKGPEEVMNISILINEFNQLNLKEKVQIAQEVKDSFRATTVLAMLIGQDMRPDELQQILDVAHPDLQDWFY